MTETVESQQRQVEILQHAGWYNACTLKERFASLREQTHPSPMYDAALAHKHLQRWKEQSPFATGTYFADRLASDGMSESDFLATVGETPQSVQMNMADVPSWLQAIEQAFSHSQLSHARDFFEQCFGDLPIDTKKRTQFNNIYRTSFLSGLHPLIAYGIQRLKEGIARLTATHASPPFDPDTIPCALFDNLAPQLAQQMSRTMTLELNVARLQGQLQGNTPEERFQHFIEKLSNNAGILPFLEEYAALARLLVTTIDQWVAYRLEFLEHLCLDWQEICQTLVEDNLVGKLVELDGSVGDLHRGGRSTLRLRFESGFQLIYKPRSLAIDVHFQQLLSWLNERGDHPAFRTIRVIDKGSHGWSEFVTAQSCSSQDEVKRFYERQGGYLALFYALEATDMNLENLIASGEHPVIIDLEALFHPRLVDPMATTPQLQAVQAMNFSVLRVGLLPLRMWGNQLQAGIDVSGMGGQQGQISPYPALQVEDRGTDQMRFTRKYMTMPGQKNRPTLTDNDINILDYTEQITGGFEKIYRLLMRYREELLPKLVHDFAQDEIRLVVRPTQVYAQLLNESLHPNLLRDMLTRDRFFDHLWANTAPHVQKVIPAEHDDLYTGNIPIFTTSPGTRDIFTSQRACITNFLDEPGLDLVKARLQGFDEQDLARQVWFIQASLASLLVTQEQGQIGWKSSQLRSSQPPVTREDLLQAACMVGDRLCEQAIQTENKAAWLGLTFINEREWSLCPAGIDLYAGIPGIALFLAYLGAITGKTGYTMVARAAFASVQAQITELLKGHRYSLPVGAFSGYGSLIYCYTHLSCLWNEPALLQEAEDIVKASLDQIEHDTALDIIAGVAGYALCLLNLYSLTSSTEVLAAAIRCGEHLISHLGHIKEGRIRASEQALTGFSHGTAGYALSLLKLAAITGQERFQRVALAALEYERSLFSSEKQNWPDLRSPEIVGIDTKQANGEASYMITWCHGAPGIGLARLASLSSLDDAMVRGEIAFALQTTVAQGFGQNHSLCHGDLGNLDVLLTASLKLDNPNYRELADQFAASILDSIDRLGWHTGVPLSIETPGLMAGIAGIGYELLRLAEPEKVPSVLALDPPML